MEYNITKINEIAQKLHLSNLVDTINCVVEGMKNCREQVTVLVVTTHNVVGKTFLKEYGGLSFGSTNRLYPCSIEFLSGNDEEYVVETEMGKINIDESTLIKQLSSKETSNLQAKVTKPFFSNKLVRLNFLYVNDFAEFSQNEWIYKLTSTDKVYLLLDGLQIFNDKEKNFAEELINSMFSSSRCAFLIGNTKFLSDSDRAEIMEYSVSIVEKGSSIMYLATDSFKKEIDDTANKALELRKRMEPEVSSFLSKKLLREIPKLKEELTSQNTNLEESIVLLSENSQVIEDSKKRISNKIDSFIKDYAFIQFEKRVNGFNRALRDSLTNDIQKSEDINDDSKWINKYMEFVWGKFISEQESWLKSTVLNEVTDIETLVNSDLNLVIDQMDSKSQKLIKDYAMSKYNVHSYLIGKEGKTDIGELSKVMKIGSIVLALFAPLTAILTFGGSELVKLAFKNKIEQGKKEHLVVAVEKMSKQMAEQVLMQANKQFDAIADKLKEQTMSVYSSILSELSDVLSSQKRNMNEKESMLSLINNIEETYK